MSSLQSTEIEHSPDDQASDPVVSVIVPSYNHEEFISKCLESINAQTHKSIELIIVDDCSRDRTFDRAKELLAHNRSRFVNSILLRNAINRGAHVALNRGLAHSSGTLISFMNSDDEYVPERLATIIHEMRVFKAQFAFSKVATIGAGGKPYWEEALCHHIAYRPRVALMRYPSLSWGLLWRQLTASTGNVVISRRLARRVGPFCSLRYCHDWDFVLRCAFFTEPLFVDEPLYRYRVHGANSFRALTTHAEPDTKKVIQNYLCRVKTSRPPNRLAPSPQNWPTSFQPLVRQIGMETHLKAVYESYLRHHRTVEATAYCE